MKQAEERAKRLLELQELLFHFTEVERQIYFPDGKRRDRFENDAEHSYSLAIAAWFLAQYFPKLDRDKLIRYALVHDFVEVHAGDVMAIGRTAEAHAAKKIREAAALKQLQNDWGDFGELTEHIEMYEQLGDPESKFVYALDKLMPMMLNLLSGGKTWQIHKMKRLDVLNNKDGVLAICPEINELWFIFRQQILDNPAFFSHDPAVRKKYSLD